MQLAPKNIRNRNSLFAFNLQRGACRGVERRNKTGLIGIRNGRTIAECLRDVIDNPYCEVSLLDCIKESMAQRKPPASERQWVKRPALILVKGAEHKSDGPLVSTSATHHEVRPQHFQMDGLRLVEQQRGFYDDGKKEF